MVQFAYHQTKAQLQDSEINNFVTSTYDTFDNLRIRIVYSDKFGGLRA